MTPQETSNCQPPCVGVIGSTRLVRHLVYRRREARTYLCVCAARDKRHALRIARQMFRLDRNAYATPLTGGIPSWL